MLSLDLMQNPSIEQWHSLHARLCGSINFRRKSLLKPQSQQSFGVRDNQNTLYIASKPVFHERTKHIEIDCHFVREKIQLDLISTGYVKIEEQLGDIFTNAPSGDRVSYLCNKLA